jgi:RimJ/RimL family protein N-acetyltransferase
VQLEADRVTLREFRLADVAECQKQHADPRFLEFYSEEVGDGAFVQTLVELFIRTAAAEPRFDYTLAVVERSTSRLIGSCSMRTAGQKKGRAEFGLGLWPDFWGRGLATEAARAMITFGFDELGLEEIRGVSVTPNHRVGRLVTKLGFVKVGERDGAPWMAARGWTHSVWALTQSAWARSGVAR